ncbi:MAG: six-cysteine peptide SCIFF [Christensenellaceae bacterium]|nr:six-cysteine peptide SCIFF [Christensenellaceae bacterium]
MKHIKTVASPSLCDTVKTGGCGECRSSCQSACKTSCTVGNQSCEKQSAQEISGREGKLNRSLNK